MQSKLMINFYYKKNIINTTIDFPLLQIYLAKSIYIPSRLQNKFSHSSFLEEVIPNACLSECFRSNLSGFPFKVISLQAKMNINH